MVANQAICAILEREQNSLSPAAFALTRTDYEEDTYGATALSVGRMTVASRLTQEANEYAFAVLKFTATTSTAS